MLRSVEAQSDAPEHELNLRASDLWGGGGVVLLKEVKPDAQVVHASGMYRENLMQIG